MIARRGRNSPASTWMWPTSSTPSCRATPGCLWRAVVAITRGAGYGTVAGLAADLWLVAIPAALSGQHEPSFGVYLQTVVQATTRASGPLTLAGLLIGAVIGTATAKTRQALTTHGCRTDLRRQSARPSARLPRVSLPGQPVDGTGVTTDQSPDTAQAHLGTSGVFRLVRCASSPKPDPRPGSDDLRDPRDGSNA